MLKVVRERHHLPLLSMTTSPWHKDGSFNIKIVFYNRCVLPEEAKYTSHFRGVWQGGKSPVGSMAFVLRGQLKPHKQPVHYIFGGPVFQLIFHQWHSTEQLLCHASPARTVNLRHCRLRSRAPASCPTTLLRPRSCSRAVYEFLQELKKPEVRYRFHLHGKMARGFGPAQAYSPASTLETHRKLKDTAEDTAQGRQ